MIFYHGSSCKTIKTFDLSHSRLKYNCEPGDMDFGKGVYLTTNFQQACEWAVKKKDEGAVYEFDIDIAKLNVLDLTGTDDYYYYLCLCRTGLEELAPDIDGYSGSDMISGLLLDGHIPDFSKYANLFLEGEISFEELQQRSQLFDYEKNQACIKSEMGISVLNDSLRNIYYISKEKVEKK